MGLWLQLLPKQLEKKELGFKKKFLKAAKIDDERVEITVLIKSFDEKEGADNLLMNDIITNHFTESIRK